MKRLGLRLHADEEHWIPLSDLMTGLMFLFLLIALAYMVEVDVQHAQAKNAVVAYASSRQQLADDIRSALGNDLEKWGGAFDQRSLSISFYGPKVLFAPGSADIQPHFKKILASFFPRYLAILTSPKYRDIVSEVRIEGFTSTSWTPGATLDESYIGNMALSQDRARAVLSYVLELPADQAEKPWLIGVLTANGLSFSHLRTNPNGTENAYESERVEFGVRTNADEQIRKVLDLSR